MNTKPVIISISGTHCTYSEPDEPPEIETVELVTDGTYDYDGQAGSFRYRESELTGMDGTTTTFRVEDRLATMTREGTVNSLMLFEPGRKHLCFYDTPYGTMNLGIRTQRFSSRMNAAGGELDLSYSIDVDNIVMSKHSFHIRLHEDTAGAPAP